MSIEFPTTNNAEKVVKVLKLSTGEDIVAQVVTKQHNIVVYNSVVVVPQPSPNGQISFGFIPFPLFADHAQLKKDGLILDEKMVVMSYSPNKNVLNAYNQQMSNLLLPGTPKILVE